MTEEYAEKMGWLEPEPEPYTEEDLEELFEKVKKEDSLPPGFWSNPNYLGTGGE